MPLLANVMRRVVVGLLLIASMVRAGLFGDGEAIITEEQQEPIWSSYTMIDSMPHEDVRMFMTVDLATNQTTNTSWAVFDKTKGANCWEH